MKNFLPLLSAAAAIGLLAGCGSKDETTPRPEQPAVTIEAPPPTSTTVIAPQATPGKTPVGPPAIVRKPGAVITTKSGLKYQDVVVGTGPAAKAGDNILVHYTGTLTNGTKFDSSVDRGEPFPFQLGVGQVIPGWDEGVAGMKVGGKRKLVIPGDLAYGPNGQGEIPPNATLNFDVQLIAIK
ncbi:MAG: FKBP-type peptidyl-prolyl cis-trans isomerase [Capsulimonas sp.]|uniref:FKBP-type peptidyl-prolyl cis-trans isomerase n=1 Tax=Capsulimonas sp. TaxID=2494211 RepID=UPI003262F7AD